MSAAARGRSSCAARPALARERRRRHAPARRPRVRRRRPRPAARHAVQLRRMVLLAGLRLDPERPRIPRLHRPPDQRPGRLSTRCISRSASSGSGYPPGRSRSRRPSPTAAAVGELVHPARLVRARARTGAARRSLRDSPSSPSVLALNARSVRSENLFHAVLPLLLLFTLRARAEHDARGLPARVEPRRRGPARRAPDPERVAGLLAGGPRGPAPALPASLADARSRLRPRHGARASGLAWPCARGSASWGGIRWASAGASGSPSTCCSSSRASTATRAFSSWDSRSWCS